MATLSVDLVPHPACRDFCVDWVSVKVDATRDGLRLTYAMTGDIASLVIPAPGPLRRADELWKSTCVEMFAMQPTGGYREFNFSPAGLWASYDFSGYRDGMTMAQTAPPEVTVSQTGGQLLIAVETAPVRGPIALAAVLEDQSGAISYWALAHPSDKPDFHHPDSFVLDLP